MATTTIRHYALQGDRNEGKLSECDDCQLRRYHSSLHIPIAANLGQETSLTTTKLHHLRPSLVCKETKLMQTTYFSMEAF